MSNERFAVIGAGHFGSSIAIALSQSGAEVLVIDSDINVIQDISEDVAYAVCVDATNKKALIAENIQDFDVVVVAIGKDFVKRLLCTANLMDLGVKRIICRTMGTNQRLILEKMGVTEFLARKMRLESFLRNGFSTRPSYPICNSLTDTELLKLSFHPNSSG